MKGVARRGWIGGLLVGSIAIGAGLANLVNAAHATGRLPGFVVAITLQFVPAGLRGLLLCMIGVAVTVVSIRRLHVAFQQTATPESGTVPQLPPVRTNASAESAPPVQSAPVLEAVNTAQPDSTPVHESTTNEPRVVEPIGSNPAQVTPVPVVATVDAAAQPAIQMPSQHTPSARAQAATGPKIVAIGGGTGMPQLLRGLRAHTDTITAIVTVADDGGSSGRLRRQMGMLPPGDFRNNIAALSESEDLITRLFQYRFASHEIANGAMRPNELGGHSFGNLFIATMAAITGSFESALAESSRVLAVRGRVLPSTLELVHLCAEVRRSKINADGEEEEEWLLVEGESQIPEAGGQIMRVFLKPEQVRAYPEAIRAILQADLIVAGPGSFFTSIMPNLLVPTVSDAICASSAPSIYLCNVATQRGETDGYTVSDHMAQLQRHAGAAFTTVLANHHYQIDTPPAPSVQWVTLPPTTKNREAKDGEQIRDTAGGFPVEYRLFMGDLVDENRPWRHDSAKLAARLMEVYRSIVS